MASEIYLELEVDAAATKRLTAVLDATRVACVLLRPDTGQNLDIATVRDLLALGQSRECAMLVADDTRLANKLGADGVHLDWSANVMDDFVLAREILPAGSIVGADAGRSRHDALLLGEAGAEYVGFRPAETRTDPDKQDSRQARLELVEWWTEVTGVPGVAFDVATPADAQRLMAVGVEFLGIPLCAGVTPDEAVALVKALASSGMPHGRSGTGD